MVKMRKGILFGVIASESIHIFCCVLPTVFSVLSLLAGMGMIPTMPGFIDDLHHIIHDYEIPMIIVSAVILIVGWILYLCAQKMDCSVEGEGCCAQPCAPKKDRTKIVMIVATLLFVVNVSVYFGFHYQYEHLDHDDHHIESHQGHNHSGHDH